MLRIQQEPARLEDPLKLEQASLGVAHAAEREPHGDGVEAFVLEFGEGVPDSKVHLKVQARPLARPPQQILARVHPDDLGHLVA